jgi:hypothetical protein
MCGMHAARSVLRKRFGIDELPALPPRRLIADSVAV